MPDQQNPTGAPPDVEAALARAAALQTPDEGDAGLPPAPSIAADPERPPPLGPFGTDAGDRVASGVVDGAAIVGTLDPLGVALDQAIGALGLLTGEAHGRGDVDVLVLAVPRGRGNAAAERLEPIIARPPQTPAE